MRHQGKITEWKDAQGFGFITPESGGKKVFVHIKSFANGQRRPVGNEIVTYELKTDANGKTRAEIVAFLGEPLPSAALSWLSNLPFILSIAFLIFILWSVFAGKLHFAVVVFYFVTSAMAFVIYAYDKLAAMNDQWRISEGSLHLIGLIGGWPGGLVAQWLFCHKTSKRPFRIIFWATVFINCGALVCLFSPLGAEALHVFLGIVR